MSKARTAVANALDASSPHGRSRRTRSSRRAPGKGGALDASGSRERIQACALALFGRYGYEGVSLQMIADEVGLHKSSLFHHYGSKVELLSDSTDAAVARLLEHFEPLLTEEAPSLDTLIATIPPIVEHLSEHPETARLLVTIMVAADDSEVRKLGSSERSLGFYVRFSRWLERARKSGVIRSVNIRQVIPNLMGLLLFYPAVAYDLRDLIGPNAFSPRARQIRKEELTRLVRAMLTGES